jgi:hypothetical protein
MRICVDRCVCFDRPFAELLAIAKKTSSTTLEALQEETEFGLACRICNPYVRRMLKTGQASFDEILTDDDEPRQR